MHDISPARRGRRPLRALAVSSLLLMALLLASVRLCWPPAAAPTTDAPTAATAATAPTSAATATTTVAPVPAAELAREAAAAPLPDPAEPTFAQRIDELVALGQRTAELAQNDEHEQALASDQVARERFARLLQRFDDAGERALDLLTTLAGDDPAHAGHRLVLQLVLAEECARRHAAATTHGDRGRIDGLVHATLDVLPTTPATIEVGSRTLVDQPYLRAVHEPMVLTLLQRASEGTLPRQVATQLLLTLWHNLQRHGERSSDELSRLALLLLADQDPSQRTAACRQLLLDARYRGLVLAWLREHRDHAVATEVANLAAKELEPAAALAILRELTPLLPSAPNAYLVLGFRAPEVVADAYRELLASGTQPQMRADLVTGVGMTTTPLGLDIATLALDHDPSPDVRLQAVFALTARRDVAQAERALQQVLDDPLVAQDPVRLGAVVLALQNLEAAGDANVLQRVGERLRLLPLADYSRQTLDGMLARGLPGGAVGTSDHGRSATR